LLKRCDESFFNVNYHGIILPTVTEDEDSTGLNRNIELSGPETNDPVVNLNQRQRRNLTSFHTKSRSPTGVVVVVVQLWLQAVNRVIKCSNKKADPQCRRDNYYQVLDY